MRRADAAVWAGHLLGVFGGHEASAHRHAATQVAVGVDGQVRLRDGAGTWHEGVAVAVRSGAAHQFAVEGRAVVAWSDALSTASRTMTSAWSAPVGVALLRDPSPALARRLERLVDAFDAAEAVRVHALLFGEATRATARSAATARRIDPVVAEACALLRAGPPEAESLSVAAVARAVGLSPARLRARVRAVTGVPPVRYRIWWRIMAAAERVAAGNGITEAAAMSGFADGAHFTRAFRSIGGVPPSFLALPGVTFSVLDDRFVQDASWRSAGRGARRHGRGSGVRSRRQLVPAGEAVAVEPLSVPCGRLNATPERLPHARVPRRSAAARRR